MPTEACGGGNTRKITAKLPDEMFQYLLKRRGMLSWLRRKPVSVSDVIREAIELTRANDAK